MSNTEHMLINPNGDLGGPKGTGDVNFLTHIDFSQIDEMDPNIFNGQKPIFESEIELEVQITEENGKYFLILKSNSKN